jgi:hypothetical protein
MILFDFPSRDRDLDQFRQRHRVRGPAQVAADSAGIAVAAEQQHGVPGGLALGGVVGGDLDHCPVVVLGALGRRAGPHPLPHSGPDQAGGCFHGEAPAGGQGHHVVGADGHDVAGAPFPDALAQVKASVDLVAGGEPGADAPVVSVLQQVAGELRLRGEHDLVGDSGQLAALLAGGPVRGQVQGAADQGVPCRGRAGEGDRDLAHRDPANGPAVLPGRPGAVRGRLLISGLVDDQHHVVLVLARGQVRGRPVRSGIQQLPLIDADPGQQVLHPVRARVPGGLCQRPAVVVIEFRQQAVHHVTAGQPRLAAGRARRYPGHQVIEQAGMRTMIYAGSSGCRVVVVFHKPA